jgi:hypothetical protein
MPEAFNPVVLLAYQRARERTAAARAERALARLGSPANQRSATAKVATRRKAPLSAEQRAAAFRAKRGPLGWIVAGSSPEDVIADSSFLRKIVNIYKVRPYMRYSGRSTINLPSGKTVRFHPSTGKVTPK